MKKISLLLLILPFVCISSKLFSQTTIFIQPFDTIPQGTVPFGWSSIKATNPASLGWGVDSSNKSTGYTGASGLRNMVIKNVGNTTGIYKLVTKSISTIGFRNIDLSFASRVSNNFMASGSTTPSLFYSTNNGSSWIALPYTDNAANSTYALVNGGTPIALPLAVNNQASLKLKWEIQIDSAASGTYRIDDLQLTGLTCITTSSTTNDTICNGSIYVFAGNTYTATGNYNVNLSNYLGCDSIATLNLFVKQSSSSTTIASICSGTTYVFNGMTFSTSVNYTHHLTNQFGCDSAAVLHLSVYNPTTSTTTASICTGNSYTFNGNTYTTSGTHTFHLLNYHGCDSSATLILTVSTGFTPAVQITTTNTSVCSGSVVTFVATPTNGGSSPLYQWYKNFTAVGLNQTTYVDNALSSADVISCTLTSNLSCVNIGTNPASSNTLTMTVNQPSSSVTAASICQGDSFLFAGAYYKAANTYLVHITNHLNCDSAATLHLSVKQPSSSLSTATICNGDSYTFNSTTYSTAGTYLIHISNAAGCDSAATLTLSVISVDTASVITNNTSITANQVGATYQWFDCTTGLAIANATSQIFTPTVSGNYKCVLTFNGCHDTTACKSINTNVGILDQPTKWNTESVFITPNPCGANFSIRTLLPIKVLQIYDLTGRICLTKLNPETENNNVSSLQSGIYFVKVTLNNGTTQSTKLIKL